MKPQLTIGIPTLDRFQFLRRAIDSCLRQTVPVRIIVADQGHLDETVDVVQGYDEYAVSGPSQIRLIQTDATCLWENWAAAARACDTPFFAWLQDDDIVSPAVKRADGSLVPGTGFAHRVLAAFDQFPEALHWQARLYCGVCDPNGSQGLDDIMASWWGGSGPWVPMPIIQQRPLQWPGEILVPTAYLTSWSMSPGVAFRCGPEFTKTIDFMPIDIPLHYERLVLASMGMQGPWIADPMVGGYWAHHGRNESYNQHPDEVRQTSVMIEYLDELMDSTDWRDIFSQWCRVMNPMQILGFGNDFKCQESRYSAEIQQIMAESLRGRIEPTEGPKQVKPWYSVPPSERVQGNDRATADLGELVWR